MSREESPPAPLVLVVMGVSGSGKTTVGRALAARLGWVFADADAYHSPDAVATMRRGAGLTDADRAPWLDRLAALVAAHLRRGEPLVLACSALKAHYRARLGGADPRVRFVWLDSPRPLLARRLREREAHFAGPSLLASQLDALEPPAEALRLDARAAPDALVAEVLRALGLGGATP